MAIVELRSLQTVTDHEGMVLGTIRRHEPLALNGTIALCRTSPICRFANEEEVDTVIGRLTRWGLIDVRKAENSSRDTEQLRCTDIGEATLRGWIRDIKPSDLFPGEPIRTKILGFDLLTFEEQIEWIVAVKSALTQKRDEIESYVENSNSKFQAFANQDALGALRARMDWLNTMMFELIKNEPDHGSSEQA